MRAGWLVTLYGKRMNKALLVLLLTLPSCYAVSGDGKSVFVFDPTDKHKKERIVYTCSYREPFTRQLKMHVFRGRAPCQYRLLGDLPNGIEFDETGPTIRGKPMEVGIFDLTYIVRDRDGKTERQYIRIVVLGC